MPPEIFRALYNPQCTRINPFAKQRGKVLSSPHFMLEKTETQGDPGTGPVNNQGSLRFHVSNSLSNALNYGQLYPLVSVHGTFTSQTQSTVSPCEPRERYGRQTKRKL